MDKRCSSVMQNLLSEPGERNNLVADVWSSNSTELPNTDVNCRVCGEDTEGEKQRACPDPSAE